MKTLFLLFIGFAVGCAFTTGLFFAGFAADEWESRNYGE